MQKHLHKVGDKVRCIDAELTQLIEGSTYTVTLLRTSHGRQFVRVEGFGERDFLGDRFVPVEVEAPCNHTPC